MTTPDAARAVPHRHNREFRRGPDGTLARLHFRARGSGYRSAFGIRAFRRERIWWHQRNWWGALPRDYWVFIPVGLALYLLSRHIVS